MEEQRPKRKAAKRSKQTVSVITPNPSYYLGYVDDNENPEMIMKKFEALEQLKQANQKEQSSNQGNQQQAEELDKIVPEQNYDDNEYLSIEEQVRLFNLTSYNTLQGLVETDQRHNDNFKGDFISDDEEYLSDDEIINQLGEDSDNEWGQIKKINRIRQKKKEQHGDISDDDSIGDINEHKINEKVIKGQKKAAQQQMAQRQKAQQTIYNMSSGRQSQVLKIRNLKNKLKQADNGNDSDGDEEEIEDIKVMEVPDYPFLPPWGRAVRACSDDPQLHPYHYKRFQSLHNLNKEKLEQYSEQFKFPCQTIEVDKICEENIDCKQFKIDAFEGILVNSGWENKMTVEELCRNPQHASAQLDLINFKKLAPYGLIFIWVDKPYIQPAMDVMEKQGYHYVEHLTWVQISCNNKILKTDFHYLGRSHLSMYIFRREVAGKQLDLRHQRSPDCVFDTVRKVKGRPWQVPEQVYNSIETLLPQGRGKMLELWAPYESPRPGWIQYIEKGHDNDCLFPG